MMTVTETLDEYDPFGDDPRSQQMAQAWELATYKSYSLRMVAQALGISKSTADRWIKTAEEAAQAIDLLDRAIERQRQAVRIRMYRSELFLEKDARKLHFTELMPHLMRLEERLARLGGLDAPARVTIDDQRPPAAPPVEVIAAVREAQRRAHAEQRELDE